MVKGCNLCGIHFKLYEQGCFYIEDKHRMNIRECFPGGFQKDTGFFIPYDSKPMLSEVIATLISLPDVELLQCTLIKKMEKPLFVYPFKEIAERIEKNEIVQIIQSTDFNGYFQPIVSLKVRKEAIA
ncbi:hypothetical protein BCI9360_02137 [Bacillus sp. CECT 9360]|nr:hypothetical protein BCI9360_02137 [Bacillus sp. CECT 9360]